MVTLPSLPHIPVHTFASSSLHLSLSSPFQQVDRDDFSHMDSKLSGFARYHLCCEATATTKASH